MAGSRRRRRIALRATGTLRVFQKHKVRTGTQCIEVSRGRPFGSSRREVPFGCPGLWNPRIRRPNLPLSIVGIQWNPLGGPPWTECSLIYHNVTQTYNPVTTQFRVLRDVTSSADAWLLSESTCRL
jgi:hypothetical protein